MAEGHGLSLITDEADQFRKAANEKPDPDAKGKKADRERQKELVEKAVKCFQVATTAEYQQRMREDEDLKFDRALPADQWPEGIRTARAGGIAEAGGVVNERPCLVINKLDQPVQQVINEARGARIAVKIKPKSDGASQEGAEIRQGIYRTIEAESRAHIGRLWALDRAVKCGRGAYRVVTKYSNDGDFDQDIVIERILNQGSVYLDPFATEPDWSDGEWALITSDIPIDEYKRRYPKSKLNGISAEELESIGNKVPGWIGSTEEEGSRTIRIAEYFYFDHEDRDLVFVPGSGKMWADKIPKHMSLPPTAVIRTIDIRHLKWCVINCEEVLEEEDRDGRYIPIIPVIGKEYNVGGDRSWKGVISNSKDAQRSYNYMRSAQVEAVGLAPKAPWIMAEGQDEGYETMWDQSNTKNYTRLKYKPVDFMGKPVAPPQRNVAEPAIQAISMAVSAAAEDIKSTTGRFDPSLGRVRADQSGKAIGMLKESGEATTSNYLENLTSISMHYEAKVILDLMPYVYDRPGRVLRVMGEEEHQDQTVMLNQPFVMGQDGQPQPAPPPGMMERLGQAVGIGGKKRRDPRFLDLRNGEYSVEVSVGKSFPTQREENAEMLRSIIESAPGLTPMLADLMVEQLDTPIAKRAAERLRKMNPQIQESEQGEQELPPEVQQKMQAMEQQMQQMTQVLEQQNEEIKSNRYKVDKDYDARIKELQVRREIAMINAQATVKNTDVKAQTDADITQMKIEAGAWDGERDREHEDTQSRRELLVDADQKERDRKEKRMERYEGMAHEVRNQARERVASREDRDVERADTREDRDATQAHEGQMKYGDAMARRREQDAQLQSDKDMRYGDALHERTTQAAEHELEREGRDHDMTKTLLTENSKQRHERGMSAEQRKADEKNAKLKANEKKTEKK
jgi:hypothetical protein